MSFTELNIPIDEIRQEIASAGLLKKPPPIPSPPAFRNRRIFYEFHQEVGHLTKNCRELKKEVERLIRERKLDRYMKKTPSNPASDEQNAENRTIQTITTIYGGPYPGGKLGER